MLCFLTFILAKCHPFVCEKDVVDFLQLQKYVLALLEEYWGLSQKGHLYQAPLSSRHSTYAACQQLSLTHWVKQL